MNEATIGFSNKPAVIGLCAAFFLMGSAFGHAKLLSSIPAAEAQLTSAPAALILTFNEKVKLAVLRLMTGGREVPVTIDRAAPAAPSVTVSLPPLAAGKYDVQWSALTLDDGHVVKGVYSFVVR